MIDKKYNLYKTIFSPYIIVFLLPIFVFFSFFVVSTYFYDNSSEFKFAFPVVIYTQFKYPDLPDKYFVDFNTSEPQNNESMDVETSMKKFDLTSTTETYIKQNIVFSDYYLYDPNTNTCKRLDKYPYYNYYSCFGGDSSCNKPYENIIYNNYIFKIPTIQDIKEIKNNFKKICNITNEINEFRTNFNYNSQYIEN